MAVIMNGNLLDRMNLLRSWSRHHNYATPKSMQDVWKTSYGNDFSGKKIGFYPDRTIVDYFSGERRWVPSRQSRNENIRTSLNERAKTGFRYWVLEKPKVSHFGRSGIGSYKAVLGIGNAPRT